MRNVLVILALAAGCGVTPADDGQLAFPNGDGKADYWSEVKMLGHLDYDTTIGVDYTTTPKYRGFTMTGTFDEIVDVTAHRGAHGHPALALYDANKQLLDTNYAPTGSASLDAHISVPLAATGTLYVVLFDLDGHAAHFDLSATHTQVCHPAICTWDQCGLVPDGCGAQEWCGPCLPTTTDARCTAYGKNCGRIYPPSGSIGIECGGCAGGTSCGGAGVADVCGVTPGHSWLSDIPRNDVGNWSGRATFTLLGIQNLGVYGTEYTMGEITCSVSGIPGSGMPMLSCHGPKFAGWGTLRADGSFMNDDRGIAGAEHDLVFAGTIEPHGRIRLTEYSENYYSPSVAHEWAFPCLLYSSPIRCTSASSWTTNATATLQLWQP